MADGCGNITTGSTNVCATPFQGGLGSPDLVLVNNDDWSSFTESAATPNLVTAVTLASGASAYAFQGYKISLKPSVDVVEGPDGRNAYIHRQAFIIYANSQVQKNNIQRLAQGRVKSLHENAGKNDDSFEWMGIGVGLQMKAQKIRDLQENGAAYMILLETPTNEPEAKLPQTYLATNYAGTVTALNIFNGTVYWKSAGTITAVSIYPGSTLDFSRDPRARACASISMYKGSTLLDPYSTISGTPAVTLVDCDFNDVTIVGGRGKIWTRN